ncbi:N-acetyl-gamma-glutamyl-phosphate reductase [Methylotenera sp.]|uniref:N-acetyl-gamma-glutamyl-phosphate reductase n=1 Tax=Methylotenera sp. TaxID=2051956 RepID=UPI002725943D|nr:N-acetyl-gamma-glutamyl-phosphate reductase [Methylotenera sp.]MDO9205268.1 N-acetyl-gamma-glutamyl-phosphate reductase [Methylotenera sp.]MDP1522907.1 N-acetyl-gamma-glutamyl-phosphate reductase [Methylotenera sp.]MDP2072372.1 N-acetyl-gamma-glutamyl-phosphate reductase [Methylotenera sp.]MDP2229400.1 N-acetyl-gamma-glutamyl-phosphate reductase [Methylotenera sp.]MDP3005615.1 N-acetyl-gamma-glutamyl-phosphate reductase [Methylotenera sp.]
MTDKKLKVGIVGGTGYTGVELLRLLSIHPNVTLTAITSRGEAGLPVADMFPSLRGYVDLAFSDPAKSNLSDCDVVFFATPHGVAMSQAQTLLDANVKIIDLAADFRLQDKAVFEKWYKMAHSCPEVLSKAVYGLPELYRKQIKSAQVIGNPGCYPTTVLLGLAPLLEQGLIDFSAPIVADSKSGVSGAGRKAEVATLFAESSDNMKAYGVSGHRHHPEIHAQLTQLAGNNQADADVQFIFVPHLIPMIRGMLSTIYVKLSEKAKTIDLQALFEQRYQHERFVDVLPAGTLPETRSVRGSNQIRIALHKQAETGYLTLVVVQDNLVKGAAGQAVQNMNIMFSLAENTGLEVVPLLP